MRLLVSFIPFFSYLIVERVAGNERGLAVGFASAIGLILWDRIGRRAEPKALEIATAALFLLIYGYVRLTSSDPSVVQVRLALDLGLLMIAAVSLAIRKPFTLQYAREATPAAFWNTPEFFRKNMLISAVWAAAFLGLVFADLLFLNPEIPRSVPMIITVASLAAASKYTTREEGPRGIHSEPS